MLLQDIYKTNNPVTFEGIAAHKDLSKQVENILTLHGLFNEEANTVFGKHSIEALKKFQAHWNIKEPFLGKQTAKALIEKKPKINDFAAKVIKAMLKYNYPISTGKSNYNICFIEGINKDGTINKDKINEWNDVCLVIEIEKDIPKIIGNFIATSEPGLHYTQKPLNVNGVARICFGSYKSWKVGKHKNHEALVQAAPVKITRDKNRDGSRVGDAIQEGIFGLNIHSGYDAISVGNVSAGCLAIQSWNNFYKFMNLIKTDSRYQKDNNYLFRVSILPANVVT